MGLAPRREVRLHTAWKADGQRALSFNGRLREEFLSVNEFIAMQDTREKLKAWQHDYNHQRPHGSLGNLTPSEFVRMRSDQQLEGQLQLHFKC